MPHLKGFHFWWNGAKDSASSSNVLVSFVAAWLSIKEAAMSPKTSSSLFTMWIVTGREEKRTMVLIRVWICNSNSFLCGQQRLFAWLKTVFLDGKKKLTWFTFYICVCTNLMEWKHSRDSILDPLPNREQWKRGCWLVLLAQFAPQHFLTKEIGW